MDTPLTVTREVELDITADELWSLIGDGDRWPEWLVDSAGVDVRPGASGVVVDDGVRRAVHVRSVEPGERVTLDWWTDDDGADRSRVELEIVRDGGAVGLRVVETFATPVAPTARASAGVRWDVRLLALHLAACALART